MHNLDTSTDNVETTTDNLLTMHSFLNNSISITKKHIKESASFFKDELTNIYDKAGICFTKMVLPVNNFLKDFTQIDLELEQEIMKEPKLVSNCNIVPIEQALQSPMEENY